jgi:hypothetical protein
MLSAHSDPGSHASYPHTPTHPSVRAVSTRFKSQDVSPHTMPPVLEITHKCTLLSFLMPNTISQFLQFRSFMRQPKHAFQDVGIYVLRRGVAKHLEAVLACKGTVPRHNLVRRDSMVAKAEYRPNSCCDGQPVHSCRFAAPCQVEPNNRTFNLGARQLDASFR